MDSWSISKLLNWTADYFKKQGREWPNLEAEILLAHSLGLKRIELYTRHETILKPEELAKFKELIKRRSQNEPIAYITGNQPFMSLNFIVNRSVLIPRPETEQLVAVAIDTIKSSPVPRHPSLIADIGTGSGAIAVTIAKFVKDVKIIGIDTSEEALKIARQNAEQHQVTDRCEFRHGDLFEPIQEKFDLILSNPPYIPTAVIDTLAVDVKDWEPRQALDGGEDGLTYIRKIINEAPDHLKPGGLLLIEIGFDQGDKAKSIAETIRKYKEIKIIKDLSGKDRILFCIT